ncbi:metallophosphoesterase family protein [Argonema galeatum]|uniref:metallophosphoesterase family protein n=1 Tax=Argonema galeatum TaxID=2942762 RepID=UPI002011C25E|nr:metallophosphoesterase family protein [Argonema galeatum]MCL1467955.1 serine/threonine protein phosphatase [Argonema galeatum A003/A1]
MRILAIGDIHGCSIALDALLAAVNPQPEDRIITLGDYVDHGPDAKGVIERLIALHEKGLLVPLRGNHEQIMLNSRADGKLLAWLSWGGEATLASYSLESDRKSLQDIPESHWDFLENKCVNWYETDTHFFVHADADPDLPLAEQPEFVLFWGLCDRPSPHFSGKTMVYGHDTQESGIPLNLGHAIGIDTWAYGNGWLTCLDVTSGKVWQANQAGQKRLFLI